MNDYLSLVKKQGRFFNSGQTKSLAFRLSALTKLETAILNNEQDILDALATDLSKAAFESYATEIGLVLDEIRYNKKQLKKWMRPKKVATGIKNWPSRGYIYPEPLGLSLIIAPWNYPFQLLLAPLVSSIAAGNCSVLKAAEDAPATERIIKEMLHQTFDEDYIALVSGDKTASTALLELKFDKIFFTGSTAVGKIVMRAASQHLTPVTLELGGKSPCIVDETASIERAAKRIVWGKFLNAGQTCVAPDYVWVHQSQKKALIEAMKREIQLMYPHPLDNADYPAVITDRHFKRLLGLIEADRLICGGQANPKNRKLAPTLLDLDGWDYPVMADEIFGPILPILTYQNFEEIQLILQEKPKPLAAYLFTTSQKNEKIFLNTLSFGGGCINDTVVHVATSRLPFGGVGASGMGSYHGFKGFETFSHFKSVLKKSQIIDLPLRYPPYQEKWFTLLKKL
ncbi:aldehyde dehydrogenase [Lactococcus sp.]|uniref:aldehyde dehydrogenase n=1 Tax=Lactococcus sp. TaxID=44273 RepID=UPI0035ADB447